MKLMKYGLDEHPLRYSEPARLSTGQLAVGGLALRRGIAPDDLQMHLPNLNTVGFLKLLQIQCKAGGSYCP